MSQPEKGSERPSMSIRNKVALRAVLGLFVIAALFLGWQFLSEFLQDPEIFEEADTAGMIAAVEERDNGSQVVIFTPEGEKMTSPGWTPGTREQTPAWIGDGDHLYFVADREERAFHIYRWIPGNDEVSRRSFGTSSITTPVTDFNDNPLSETTMLVRKGGTMSLLDLAEGSTE
ncbi:MAG: hypothetical protein ACOCX1_02525, partial [Fimbriimonadaceae bacterium]